MTNPAEATIVPIEITVGGRTGVTLWAPPWEEDGDEWQAFLGSGDKLEVFERAEDLAAYVARSGDNDLVDHPSWDMVQTLPAAQLRPEDDYRYDIDGVPELVEDDEPDEDTRSDLADTLDMVQRIAECVDDGPLLHMLEGPAFAKFFAEEGDLDFSTEEWEEFQQTISRSWSLLTERLNNALHWHTTEADNGEPAADPTDFWDEVGILPVSVTAGGRTGFTLRCYLDDSAIFLGSDLNIDVFERPAALIEFIRTASDTDLAELDTWPAVRDAAVLDVSPAAHERYDLSGTGASSKEIASDIADYAKLAGVKETLASDEPDWELVVNDVTSCLRWH